MSVVQKFIDDPETVAADYIHALCACDPLLTRIANTNAIAAVTIDPTKVAVVGGGGCGHEPLHSGFVAPGWLSVAVNGNICAAPPSAHILAGIEHIAKIQGPNGPGMVILITNYAGDCLNFDFAISQAKVKGIKVASVLAADDAVFGVEDISRRRGLAGCTLLYKILGAAAQSGLNFEEMVQLAKRLTDNLRSIGVSLSSCSLPGGPMSSSIPYGQVEVGMGAHGEAGPHRAVFTRASTIVKQMLEFLLATNKLPKEQQLLTPAMLQKVHPPPPGSKVLLLVNNLGGTTELELRIMAFLGVRELTENGYTVLGVCVGNYLTCLDMHGVSFSLLRVASDADLKFMLNTDHLQKGMMNFTEPSLSRPISAGPLTALQLAKKEANDTPNPAADASPLRQAVERVFKHLLTMEAAFNALDAAVGDGDLGSGVHRASAASLQLLPYLPWEKDLLRTFTLISKACADACAGTSGPLYGALILGGGKGAHAKAAAGAGPGVEAVRAAIASGSDEVQKLGGARKGDRTMVDVLEGLRESPKVQGAKTMPELLAACLEAGREAAKVTSQLPAKFGRSRYMNGKEIGQKDPGAELIVAWLEVLARSSSASNL